MNSILIIVTSTDAASLALIMNGELVAEKHLISDRKHNAMLFDPMRELIEINNGASLDAIFVGSGPGSYSGTRVGIAAAQGAALVSGCKVTAIPSFIATPLAITEDECLVIGDARRGNFWTAKTRTGSIAEPPCLTDEIGLNAMIHQACIRKNCVFSLDGFREPALPRSSPTASGLWKAWQPASSLQKSIWSKLPPQPIYLAPPHITPSKKLTFGQ